MTRAEFDEIKERKGEQEVMWIRRWCSAGRSWVAEMVMIKLYSIKFGKD